MNSKSKILVVDDDREIIGLLTLILSSENYEVFPADSGELALECALSIRPDLILLDIKMPGIDGFEVCTRLKSYPELKEIPVIFLSSTSEIEARVQGLRLGAVDFLSKPFRQEELLARVKTHLDLYSYNRMFKEMTAQELIQKDLLLEKQNNELKQLNIKLRATGRELFRAKEIAELNEEKYRRIFENSQSLILELNLNTLKIISCNPAMAAKLGNQESFFQGKPITEVFAEQKVKEFKFLLSDFLANNEVKSYEAESGGEYYYVNLIPYSNQFNKNLLIVAYNITQNKIAEQKRIEEYNFRTAIENSMVAGVAIVDANGKQIYVNKFFYTMLGFTEEEILGKYAPFIYWSEEDLPAIDLAFRKTMAGEAPEEGFELRFRHKDGHKIDCLVKISEFKKATGETIGFLAVVSEITQLKLAEQNIVEKNNALVQLMSDKDRFMRILAHDLRSPFHALLGFTDLLVADLYELTLPEIERHLKMLRTSVRSTFTLLDDILLWSKAQEGQLAYEPTPADLIDIYESVVKGIELIAAEKNITLERAFRKGIWLDVDLNMMQTVLRNLLSNAVKFTPDSGTITVSALKKNMFAEISVEDTGIGMSDEDMGKLWNPSQPYTSKGTNNEKGSGLGLFLCKEFVEKHGGTLSVRSEKGKGSVFSFTMPLHLVPEAETV